MLKSPYVLRFTIVIVLSVSASTLVLNKNGLKKLAVLLS